MPDAAEEVREVAPAALAQHVRRLGVAEDAGLLLGEDAVARERAQDAVQRVRVGAGLARELVDRPRGPAASASATPRSATMRQPSSRARRAAAPRPDLGRLARRSPRGARRRPPPPPRPPPRRRASGSRAGGGRRGRPPRRAGRRPQRSRQLLLDRAGQARQLGERQRAPADARDRLLDLAADEPREPLGARRTDVGGLAEHPQHRDLDSARRGRAESVPSSAASVSLSARSARWSGWRRRRSTRSARPTTIPACGPPSSLSPEKQTRSAPARARRAPRARRLEVDRARPSRDRRRAAARAARDRGELLERAAAR